MAGKLEILARVEGHASVQQMLITHCMDSVVEGICTNPDCNYTNPSMEPDAHGYDCEVCGTPTVNSSLMIAGVI